MSKYWNNTVRNLNPYIPGEQPKDKRYIKLNTNENPYPPSPRVIEAVKKAANEDLRLYPDPNGDRARTAIADYYGLKKEQIFLGNGSDEVLAFSFGAFFEAGKPVLFPDITYTFYQVYAGLFHLDYRTIPVDEGFGIRTEPYMTDNGGIIIPNPNAPTTINLSDGQILEIVKHNHENCGKVVIIDEAYIDFGGESVVKYINEFPNLLVIHTLSKARSLAGLRIGFAMGNQELIEGLDRIKNSFNSYTMDTVALAAAREAFLDTQYFQEITKKIVHTREWVSRRLLSTGYRVLDSRANFLFISHPEIFAGKLFEKLRERGILVRYFNKPRIDDFLRVSVGSDEEMETFCSVLETIRD